MQQQQQHHHQRPASSYYDYETVQKYSTIQSHHQQQQPMRKTSAPSPPTKLNGHVGILGGSHGPASGAALISGSSGRHRGPFVTQVTIRDQNHHHLHHGQPQPASKV